MERWPGLCRPRLSARFSGPSGRQVLVNGHDWPKLAAKTAAQFVAQSDRWPGRQDIVSVSTHELCERGDWDNGLAEATANVLHTQINTGPTFLYFLVGQYLSV